MSRRLNSHSISRDPRRLLCLIALLLALAEIADAFFVSFPPGPAVFAMLLLAGTLWTIRREWTRRPKPPRRALRIRDRKRPLLAAARHRGLDHHHRLRPHRGRRTPPRHPRDPRRAEQRDESGSTRSLNPCRQPPAAFALRKGPPKRAFPSRGSGWIPTNAGIRQRFTARSRENGSNGPFRRWPRQRQSGCQ